MNKKLVLFDFDGTLTKHDTLFWFLHFVGGCFFYLYLPRLLCIFVAHKFGIYSAKVGKEKLLSAMLNGKTQDEVENVGKDFAAHLLANKSHYFRKNSLEYVEKYKQYGADIYIVSASPSVWVAPVAKRLDIKFICTEFLYENGIFTGKFLGENCNGAEKVRRIEQEIPNLDEYSRIVAYGDSKGDLPMLALAHEKHFKPFRG